MLESRLPELRVTSGADTVSSCVSIRLVFGTVDSADIWLVDSIGRSPLSVACLTAFTKSEELTSVSGEVDAKREVKEAGEIFRLSGFDISIR